jgi:hypothetical protein
VGPRSVLDAVMKRKIPSPRRESNSRTSIVQPIAQTVITSNLTNSSSISPSASDKCRATCCERLLTNPYTPTMDIFVTATL